MGIFAVPSAMQVKRQSGAPLKVKVKVRQFIPEAEDIEVFLPPLYKLTNINESSPRSERRCILLVVPPSFLVESANER
jgi:hypothetical protein